MGLGSGAHGETDARVSNACFLLHHCHFDLHLPLPPLATTQFCDALDLAQTLAECENEHILLVSVTVSRLIPHVLQG